MASGLSRLSAHFPRNVRRISGLSIRLGRLKILPSAACLFVRKRRVVSGIIVGMLAPIYATLQHRQRRRVGGLTRRSRRFRGRLAYCRGDRIGIRMVLHGGDTCGSLCLCR